MPAIDGIANTTICGRDAASSPAISPICAAQCPFAGEPVLQMCPSDFAMAMVHSHPAGAETFARTSHAPKSMSLDSLHPALCSSPDGGSERSACYCNILNIHLVYQSNGLQ